jgi:hypothetical protein
MTIDSFKREVAAAVKAYDHHVVCLGKSPAEFEASLLSLFSKPMKTAGRGCGTALRWTSR